VFPRHPDARSGGKEREGRRTLWRARSP